MLSLGGMLQLRCNWEVYAQEFALALREIGGNAVAVNKLQQDAVSSPFEKKYRSSGLPLFQVKTELA